MAGPSLGDAVIEITADMSGFDRSLNDGLKSARTSVGKSGNDAGKQLGNSIAAGTTSEINKNKPRFAQAGASAGAALGDGTRSSARKSFTGIGDIMTRALAPIRNVAAKVGAGVSTAFRTVATGVGRVFSPVANAARTAFGKVSGVVSGVFGKLAGPARAAAGKVRGVFSKLGSALGPVFTKIGGVARSVFSKIGGVVSSTISKAVTVAKTTAKVGLAAVGAAAGAALAKGFGRLTGIENAEASLKGLGYSAKSAADIINGPVLKAVQGTAFGLDEAAQAAQGALGAGVQNGTQLADYLTLVGDAASQAQVDFGSMAQIMNKVQGAGKLTGDTLQQMADNGLQVMPMLTKAYGKNQAQISEMVSNGEISAKQFQKIMQDNIGGAAQKAGETVTGSFKNMGAAVGRLGARFLGSSFGQLQKIFTGISGTLDGMGASAEAIGNKLGGFLKPLADGIAKFGANAKENGIAKAFAGLKDAAALFNPLLTVIKAAIPVLAEFGKSFKNVITNQMASFSRALSSLDTGPLIAAITIIGQALTSVMNSVGKLDFGAIFQPLLQAAVALLGILPDLLPPIMQLVSVLAGSLGKILPVIAQGIGALAKIIGSVLAAVLPTVAGLITTLVKVLTNGLMAVLPVLLPLINAVAGVLGTILAQAVKNAADVINILVSTVLPPLLDVFVALAPVLTKLITTLLPPLLNIFKALAPALIPLLGLFAKLIVALLPALVGVLNLITPLLTGLANVLGFVLTKVAQAIGWFVKWITTTGNVGKAFTALRSMISGVISGIGSNLSRFTVNVGKWFTAVGKAIARPFVSAATAIGKFWDGTKKQFSSATSWVGSSWRKSWSKVSSWMSTAVGKGRTSIASIWDRVTGKFTAARKWVGTNWRNSWSKVSSWMGDAVGKGRDRIGSILGNVRDRFTNFKSGIGTNWRKSWANVSTWMSKAVGTGRDKIGSFLGGTRDRFSNFKSWVGNNWAKSWNRASEWLAHPIRNGRDLIARIMGNKGVQKIFRSAVSAIAKIMGGLKSAFASPVNWVINNVLIPLVSAINKIGKVVNAPTVPGPSPVKGYATGGIYPGYTPGRDVGIIGVSGGEGILRPELTRAVGPQWVDAGNAAARSGGVMGAKQFLAAQKYGPYLGGFATGGRVYPVGATPMNNNLYDRTVHTGVDFPRTTGTPIHAAAPGKIVYTGWGRGFGQAIFEQFLDGLQSVYGHTSAVTTKQGATVGAGDVIGRVGSTGHSTGPHLHFEVNGAGSLGGTHANRQATLNWLHGAGVSAKGSSVFGKIKDVLMDPTKVISGAVQKKIDQFAGMDLGKSPWAKMVLGLPKMLMSKAISWGKDKLGSLVGASGEEPAGSGVERWRGTIKTALTANKLPTTDAYVNAWLRQVKSESGGNPKAVQHGYTDVNTISGDLAKGLLQTIGATFNAYKFPGHGNIFAGLDNALAAIAYAKSRYGGSMLGVIGHGHGYDSGGWLPPGLSTVINNTGRREPAAVFTQDQWDILSNIAQGRDRAPNRPQDPVNIHLHGVIDSASAAREIEQLLVRRGRITGGVNLPSRSRKLVRHT